MAILFSLLLAFLAQNLATPWPYDFATVCVTLGVLLALTVSRSHGRPQSSSLLFLALAALFIVAWQFLPASLAAACLMLLAAALFVYETSNALPGVTAAEAAPIGIAATSNAPRAETGSPLPANRHAVLAPLLPLSPRAANAIQAAIIIIVLCASAVLAIYDNGHIQPGLHGDEAESGTEARNINAGRYSTLIGVGWYDQPLPSFVVQAAGLRIFGDDVSGLRTTSAVISLAALPLLYWLARRMFGGRVALIALVFMAFAHWFIAYARIGINYNQTLLLELVAVLAFWEGWRTRKWYWWALCGAATGAGLYLYFASRLVPIMLAAFVAYLWLLDRLDGVPLPAWANLKRVFPGKRAARSPEADKATAPQRLPALAVNRRAPGPPRRLHMPAFRHLALWLAITFIIFAPIGIYFADHAKELNSRAAFVFLFSDTQFNTREEKMQIYTGSQNIPTALLVQVQRYVTLFNWGGDRSGQYGNSLSLLDYYTAVFFVLGLAYAVPRWREPRFALLLLWLVLTTFIGGVLTIESPFTPRLIGVMPVPFLLAAVALEQVYVRVRAELSAPTNSEWVTWLGARWSAAIDRFARWAPAAAAIVLLAACIYWNYWAYFEHYIHSIDGWAQREPATAVARYAAALQPDQTLYVLSQPELYVWHGTIRFVAPYVRGFDLLDPENDLPVRDAQTQRASFVMLPNHVEWVSVLRRLYPHGQTREFRRANGDLWYTIYEAGADDIAAAR